MAVCGLLNNKLIIKISQKKSKTNNTSLILIFDIRQKLTKKFKFLIILTQRRRRRKKKKLNLLRCSVVSYIGSLNWLNAEAEWMCLECGGRPASWRRCVCVFLFCDLNSLAIHPRHPLPLKFLLLCICICRLLTVLWTIQFHYIPYAHFGWRNSHWEIIIKDFTLYSVKCNFHQTLSFSVCFC